MKRLFILAISVLLIGCAKSNETPQETVTECTSAHTIDLPETHLNVFGVSMDLNVDDFNSELSAVFHDTIETKRGWWNSSMKPQKVINVCGLPFACQIDTIANIVTKVTLTSPTIATDDQDLIGLEIINTVYDSLAVVYGGKKNKSTSQMRGFGLGNWNLENGWVKFTWEGCCAVSHCTIEFIDRENMLLSLLGTTDVTKITEDTCVLGHLYLHDTSCVLDAPHGFYLIQKDSDLLIVPQYRGGDFLQKRFGKGSYYKARVKNSQYPYLEFPKDELVEYDEAKGMDWLHKTDSSSVVVRAWQLPDSKGYVYYVAHQDTYADMLPLWTTLIYSPASLSKKFIHKNYSVEHFWPNDMRY